MQESNYRNNLTKRWYIRAAIIAAVIGCYVLACKARGCENTENWPDSSSWPSNPDCRGTRSDSLKLMELTLEYFPRWVIIPAAVFGFSGYSLDLLYRRLRKRRQGAA